jgi:hypothetical protein
VRCFTVHAFVMDLGRHNFTGTNNVKLVERAGEAS